MTKKSFIRLGAQLYDLSHGLVMGIINATPDSFYADSRIRNEADLRDKVEQMAIEGVDLIDIGAMSSRPGASIISEEEEWERLQPVLAFMQSHYPGIPVSVDTIRSAIAERAFNDFGIAMINDISAGLMDPEMPAVVAKLQIPIVLMHMQNSPEDMQNSPQYDNVTMEVMQFLGQRLDVFRQKGVNDLIIDPGFGFGKSVKHNFILLNELDKFVQTGFPVMVGLSRKSMIYNSLQLDQEDVLNGSTALHTIARQKGAQIFRVHDVKEARESIKLANQVMNPDIIKV